MSFDASTKSVALTELRNSHAKPRVFRSILF